MYKTRSIAADEIKKNRVSISDSVVKASREVKIGEVIKIKKTSITYTIKVEKIPKNRIAPKLVAEHITDLTDAKEYEMLKIKRAQQSYYRQKGEGRPTKKDRRDIAGFVLQEQSEWDDFFMEESNDDEALFDD